MEATSAIKRLEELLRTVKETVLPLKHLNILVSSLPVVMVGKVRISIDPLLEVGNRLYSGTIFQLTLEERKKSDVLAYGGDYKELLDSLRFPTDRNRNVKPFGVVFPLMKLWASCGFKSLANKRTVAVLVHSSGADMFHEKLSIASMLWDAGFIVELIRDESVPPEYVSQLIRVRGIQYTVLLKDQLSRGQFGTVKLRACDRKLEMDIGRREIVETIRALINETEKSITAKVDAEVDIPQTISNIAPLNVSLFSPFTKVKGTQKTLIMEKAVRSMAPLISCFTSSHHPIEVVAHDLPRDLVRRISDCLSEGDDTLRKSIDSADREAAVKLRSLLRGLKDKSLHIFLYNYREQWIELVSFL